MPVHHQYCRHLRFPGGKLCKKITMEMVRTWKGWYSVFYDHNLALLLIIISTLKVISPRNIPTSLTPNFFGWWLHQIRIIWENIPPFGFIGCLRSQWLVYRCPTPESYLPSIPQVLPVLFFEFHYAQHSSLIVNGTNSRAMKGTTSGSLPPHKQLCRDRGFDASNLAKR